MKNGGGHFAPKLGGQFELESGGHFKLELGGQYHWNLQFIFLMIISLSHEIVDVIKCLYLLKNDISDIILYTPLYNVVLNFASPIIKFSDEYMHTSAPCPVTVKLSPLFITPVLRLESI